jgi:hypothetical protein
MFKVTGGVGSCFKNENRVASAVVAPQEGARNALTEGASKPLAVHSKASARGDLHAV